MTGLRSLLKDFYRDKLVELLRHQAAARLMPEYDVNNAYQYILNRDEVHLSWVRRALEDFGQTVEELPEPDRANGRGASKPPSTLLEEDAASASAFIGRWSPRIETVSNARHRGMLRVILGEVAEQKRSFEQALAGQLDLLGRRTEEVGPRTGHVLPTRWVE